MPKDAKEKKADPARRRPESFFLIAGPCVIESADHCLGLARRLDALCRELDVPLIFKASYDKANRSSLDAYRGPGLEKGLAILKRIKDAVGVPVLSDVHETVQVKKAAAVLDVLQIPAFLCRQTDLVLAAAEAGKPVNVKKGQFLSPHDMKNVVEKIRSRGNDMIYLTERGTMFGYNNLVVDMRAIPILKSFGCQVVIDASHSVQRPGGRGFQSGGEAEFIPTIAKAAFAAGADGLFVEVHDHPEKAKSDKYNSFNINNLKELLGDLVRLRRAL